MRKSRDSLSDYLEPSTPTCTSILPRTRPNAGTRLHRCRAVRPARHSKTAGIFSTSRGAAALLGVRPARTARTHQYIPAHLSRAAAPLSHLPKTILSSRALDVLDVTILSSSCQRGDQGHARGPRPCGADERNSGKMRIVTCH